MMATTLWQQLQQRHALRSMNSRIPFCCIRRQRVFRSNRTELSTPATTDKLFPGNSNGNSAPKTLVRPTIVYQDDHLLLVNKPPGWHSVPNQQNNLQEPTPVVAIAPNNKCLLTELKRQKLGGGTDQQFLLPLHRIDQPCSGLLLLAKTKRVASRITQLWKQQDMQPDEHQHHPTDDDDDHNINTEQSTNSDIDAGGMHKTYLCVVWTDAIPRLLEESTLLVHDSSNNASDNLRQDHNDGTWFQLRGLWHKDVKQRPRRSPPQKQQSGPNNNPPRADISLQGWSVVMTKVNGNEPNPPVATSTPSTRLCELSWRILPPTNQSIEQLVHTTTTGAVFSDVCLLEIRTRQGARHMIRAMLAQIGHCSIVGDVRYGHHNHKTRALYSSLGWDQSVALHARNLEWFQAMPSKKKRQKRRRFFFSATIPKSWNTFFGIKEDHLLKWGV